MESELRGHARADDPIYEAMFQHMLLPYLEAARRWWSKMEHKSYPYAACFQVEGEPVGFFEKFCKSPTHSAIFGVQAFPAVSCSVLKWPGPVAGGSMKMIDHLMMNERKQDEFTLILKRGLHSTMGTTRFICMVPTKVLESISPARWVYLKPTEIIELINGIVTPELADRLLPYAREYKGEVPNAWSVKSIEKYGKERIRREHVPFG